MLVDNSTSNQASLAIPPVSYLQERFKSSPLHLRLISWKLVSPTVLYFWHVSRTKLAVVESSVV